MRALNPKPYGPMGSGVEGRLRSGVAGLVGYAGQQIAFFPAAAGSCAWSSQMQVGDAEKDDRSLNHNSYTILEGSLL